MLQHLPAIFSIAGSRNLDSETSVSIELSWFRGFRVSNVAHPKFNWKLVGLVCKGRCVQQWLLSAEG